MYEFIEPQKNVRLKAFLWVAYSEALACLRRSEYYYTNIIAEGLELPFWESNQDDVLRTEIQITEGTRDIEMISGILSAVRLNVSTLQIQANDFCKMDSIVKKAK
jgi:hypothetical protein